VGGSHAGRVGYLHGIAGIGKSVLVRRFLRADERLALRPSPTVLALYHYEVFRLMDTWLRDWRDHLS
jgi:tRNA A37 threonylcarbamoyladenosine biosynthesis protein TsaE